MSASQGALENFQLSDGGKEQVTIEIKASKKEMLSFPFRKKNAYFGYTITYSLAQ
jgi:hypothetical protein